MSTAVKTGVNARAQRGTGGSHGPGPIDRFLDAVWMERGLSPNTLAAYRADLTALDRWLEGHEAELTSANRGDLLAFMASRVQAGAQPRSTARQLSSFRRFYRYLLREGALNLRQQAGRCSGLLVGRGGQIGRGGARTHGRGSVVDSRRHTRGPSGPGRRECFTLHQRHVPPSLCRPEAPKPASCQTHPRHRARACSRPC